MRRANLYIGLSAEAQDTRKRVSQVLVVLDVVSVDRARILSGPFRLKSNRDRLLISDELPFRQVAFIAASSIIVGALTGVIAASGNSFSFGYDVINYRGARSPPV